MAAGANEVFQFPGWSAATNPATTGGVAGAGSTYRATPIDFQIEYKVTSRKKAFLWLDDSISEGATGVVSTSYPTTCRPCSIQDSYPALWARASGFLLQNIAQSNLYARDWAVTSADRWNRTDLAAGKFDGAFIAAGSNDYANNRSLAQYQADVATIISKIKDTIGADKPIYLVDIMPRTDASIRESLRTQYNNWLHPASRNRRYRPGFRRLCRYPRRKYRYLAMTCDGAHPSFAGILALADRSPCTSPLARPCATKSPTLRGWGLRRADCLLRPLAGTPQEIARNRVALLKSSTESRNCEHCASLCRRNH